MRCCFRGAWLASIIAILSANSAFAALTIKTPPKNLTVNAGSTATFSVVTTNGAVTAYQWQFKGTNLADGAAISGATGPTLTVENVRTNQVGSYRVVVTGASGPITSGNATLTVQQGTIIRYHVEGAGDMLVELFDHDKPATVQNFLHYVTEHFNPASGFLVHGYTNTFFHRLEPSFVLQGGGWFSKDSLGPSFSERSDPALSIYDVFGFWVLNFLDDPLFPFTIDSEFNYGPHIRNTFGTLAMARTGDPDSASSEYFFNLNDNSTNRVGDDAGLNLDAQTGGFTVFGRVIDGLNGTNVLGFFNTLSKTNHGVADLTDFYFYAGTFSQLPVRDSFVPQEIILDNTVATVTGTWSTGDTATNKFGSDYLYHNGGAPNEWVEFTTNLPVNGAWSVYEWHSEGPDRTTNAEIIVNAKYGSFTNTIDQRTNGGMWNLVGNFDFDTNSNSTVKITASHTNSAEIVVADAIKFSKAPGNKDLFYTDLSLVTKPVIDQVGPKVSITFPLPNARLTNGAITLSGKASDNNSVARVVITYLYSYTDNVLIYIGQNAQGTTNWSITPPPLKPGRYYLRVTAQDGRGYQAVVDEDFYILGPMHIIINGPGTVTPVTDGQLLEIGKLYSVTAKPKAGALFKNWSDGSHLLTAPTVGFYMYDGLTLTANFISNNFPKALAFTYPKANGFVTNTEFALTGTASTNLAAAVISCNVISDQTRLLIATNLVAERTGTSGTNWSVPLQLAPGGYIAMVVATNVDGGTTMIQEHFTVKAKMTVNVIGPGKVTPDLNGQFLEVGKAYTLLAAPTNKGQLFATWTGEGMNSLDPKKTFTMSSNLVLTATFVSNYFPNLQGNYFGLFSPATNGPTTNVTTGDAGFFQMSSTAAGAYSGKLLLEGLTIPFSGKFDYAGNARLELNRTGTNPVVLTLALDLTNTTGVVRGSVTNARWAADLFGLRAVKILSTNSMPVPGKFLLTIPGDSGATNSPTSNSFAGLTVAAGGQITVKGTLADKTTFSQSIGVAADGSWPLYGSFYKGKGMIFGWQDFASRSNGIGQAKWIKPATTSGYFTNGFSLDLPTSIGPVGP